jgi:hypothetical protein
MVVAFGMACAPRHVPTAEGRIRATRPFTVIELQPSDGPLEAQLTREVARAIAWQQRPFVEVTSRWCDQCHWLDYGLHDPQLSNAFSGTYIIRVDVERWNARMSRTGLDYYAQTIPAFVALDGDGRLTHDWIDVRSWRLSTPDLAAGPLRDFFANAAFATSVR